MVKLHLCLFVLATCLLARYSVSEYERFAGKLPVNTQNEFSSCSSLCNQLITSLRATMSKQKGPVCRDKAVLLYLCSLLLAQSYAPEPNPGPRPVKFPCVICEKAVRWNTPGVCCDHCNR